MRSSYLLGNNERRCREQIGTYLPMYVHLPPRIYFSPRAPIHGRQNRLSV
jgi:hypothetical protein